MKARPALLVSVLLAALFSGLALYEYLSLPSATSPADQLQRIFLLDASAAGIIGLLYSVAARIDLLRLSSGKDIVYDFRIPAAVVSASLAAASGYVYLTYRLALYIVPVPALLLVTIVSLRGSYPFRGTAKLPKLERLTEDRMVRFVTSKDRLKRLAEYRSRRFSRLLARSGEIGNPYILAAKSVSWSLAAASAAIPAAALLAVSVSPVLIATALVPVFIYVYPELRLRDRANQRREGVEKELPFFSIMVNVLGSAGVSLYSIFDGMVWTRIFTSIKREALLVRRDVRVFGADPNGTFERIASDHPSKRFSLFLNGYTSKVRSGGDIPAYLAGESGSLLRELEESWARYADRAGTIGSMMVTLFGVVPLMILIVGYFSPSFSVVSLLTFTAVVVPTFTVLLVFLAGRIQPVGEEPLAGSGRRALLLSVPGLGVGFLGGQVWLGMASVVILFFVLYGYSVREQRRTMQEIDQALPAFMKDMLEFKRQEYDLTRSILKTAAYNKYSPAFDGLITRIATELKAGTPLDEVGADAKTRLGRMVFFILGQMARSGGGTVETFYQLTAYTTKVDEMKRRTRSEMRPYLLLSHVTPVLLAFGVAFISGVLGAFGSSFNQNLAASHIALPSGVFHPELFQASSALIVAAAAAMGLVGSKLTDYTVRNTLRASTNVVIAVAATAILSGLNIAGMFHIAY